MISSWKTLRQRALAHQPAHPEPTTSTRDVVGPSRRVFRFSPGQGTENLQAEFVQHGVGHLRCELRRLACRAGVGRLRGHERTRLRNPSGGASQPHAASHTGLGDQPMRGGRFGGCGQPWVGRPLRKPLIAPGAKRLREPRKEKGVVAFAEQEIAGFPGYFPLSAACRCRATAGSLFSPEVTCEPLVRAAG